MYWITGCKIQRKRTMWDLSILLYSTFIFSDHEHSVVSKAGETWAWLCEPLLFNSLQVIGLKSSWVWHCNGIVIGWKQMYPSRLFGENSSLGGFEISGSKLNESMLSSILITVIARHTKTDYYELLVNDCCRCFSMLNIANKTVLCD